VKRVLVIRFSSIGDIVLTTPVIRNIKRCMPDCEIHYLTKPAFSFLLEHNPYISKIHTLQDSILQTALLLKQFSFDAVIDLHHNLRSQIISAVLQAPTFRFNKLNVEKWQFVQFRTPVLPAKHIVDRYMETVLPLGVTNDGGGLDYFLPQNVTVDSLPKNYDVYIIGAQHFTKRMPVHKIKSWCANHSNPIVLLGGKEDATSGNQIAEGLNHVINLCGQLSFHESAWVVKGGNRILTHDTGLMHVAAAFKKPVDVIWGNTLPEFGMNPYYGNAPISHINHQVQSLACRPCGKIGFPACPKGHFKCMEEQVID
jgi:ADP-heptose:LPS heptosyltransferase